MTRVTLLTSLRRGWVARMLGSVGLAGAVLGSVPLQAADYTGANVDEFIAEMTRDYGFASEQLRDLFK